MISEINALEKYADFINDITGDPHFSDPHFKYDKDNLYDAPGKKNHKIFAVLNEEEIRGLFVFLIIPAEKYMEMMIGLSRREEAFEEMFSFLEGQYPQYQVDFVINPGNTALRSVLEKRNADFEKEQQKMVWVREMPGKTDYTVQLLPAEYEEQYKALHTKDTYWTAERVLEAKDRFRVFTVIRDNRIIGYLDVTYCYEENEPYALWIRDEYKNTDCGQALLREALRQNQPHRMMVLVDTDAFDEIRIYEAAGFERVEGQNSMYATYTS